MDHFDDEFHKTFTKKTTDHIVNAIQAAAENASGQYDPGIGGNATTFGVDVYHFGVHELKNLAALYPDTFRYKSVGNLFRLYVGDYEIAYHRVGDDADQDINSSFPNNVGAAFKMIEEQLFLPGMEPKTPKKFVLGHFANPVDGLSGVYLCVPSKHENRRLSEWSMTHELWKSTAESKPTNAPTQDPAKAPPEQIGNLNLRRRKRKDIIEDNND